MKDIIAKLGITPPPWQFKKYFPKFYYRLSSNYDGYMFEVGKNAGSDRAQYDNQWEKNVRVAEYAPEMLEALIDLARRKEYAAYNAYMENGWGDESEKKATEEVKKYTDIIKNATGLEWEKVKEL